MADPRGTASEGKPDRRRCTPGNTEVKRKKGLRKELRMPQK